MNDPTLETDPTLAEPTPEKVYVTREKDYDDPSITHFNAVEDAADRVFSGDEAVVAEYQFVRLVKVRSVVSLRLYDPKEDE